MERVVTINLNGHPYPMDEPAYEALRGYLDRASISLADNPDRAEILLDLEQAIGDKCASRRSPHRSVVSMDEMTRVLEEMGPVEGGGAERPEGAADGAGAGGGTGGPSAGATNRDWRGPRRRIYRIRDDAKVAGVCAGIGAYFDLDPNLVRLLFVVATLFSGGLVVLVYVAMMFVIPSAHTAEEWAAAHGVPFNAQQVIDRAKREYGRLTHRDPNGGPPRPPRRRGRDADRTRRPLPDDPGPNAQGVAARIFAGTLVLLLSILSGALLIVFLVAIFSLLEGGTVLGWILPWDVPTWLAIVVLSVAYAALAGPLRQLRWAVASDGGCGRRGSGAFFLVLTLVALGAVAYSLVPGLDDWLRDLPDPAGRIEVHHL